MMLNLGFGDTFYTEGSKTLELRLLPDAPTETYNKSNMFVAVGLDISF